MASDGKSAVIGDQTATRSGKQPTPEAGPESSPEVLFGEVTWTCSRRSVLVAATWWSSSTARVGRYTSSWRAVPSPLADFAGVISHMPVSGQCDKLMLPGALCPVQIRLRLGCSQLLTLESQSPENQTLACRWHKSDHILREPSVSHDVGL